MSRARLLLSESWASIRQNLSTTIAATMTVLIGMCLLGLFIALGTWVLAWSNHLQHQLSVKVNFCNTVSMPNCTKDATNAQEEAVRQELLATPNVENVEFRSKEDALKAEQKADPSLFTTTLPSNPLPDEWIVTLTSPKYTPTVGRAICAAHYSGVEPCPDAGTRRFGNIGGAVWGSTITKRVLSIGKIISLVFLIAVILLLIASTLLIANTIRLSIFSRRREIEVMKLVGATNWFIRGPFMLEGLICGFFGSLLAVILLFLGKELVLPSINVAGGTSDGVHALSFSMNALALIVAGLLLGAAGSGLTIRRFLQV
ncbi:MAG TPA: permease-like cell division protein FtsX [Gaiellaceae bacterium]|jgi:cell division transport system permease protein